jgi:hypothetical protein
LSQHSPVPDRTAKIATVLYSRCLEHGKWPDRIEFTKYLYLLDWASTQLTGGPATEIRWKFYHYGPWSEDVIPIMALVQDEFKLGWVDYSTEDRDVPQFDPIGEKLSLSLEALINRVLTAFSKRDVSTIIDFCYRLTEPMRAAKRGDLLDFSTVEVTHQAPVFVPPSVVLPMPQFSDAQASARKQLHERAAAGRTKYEQWKAAMQGPEYLRAMEKIAAEREIPTSHEPSQAKVKLTDEALTEIDKLRYE